MVTREYDKALEEGEKSIVLGPNSADAHAWYAQVLVSAGEPSRGISLAEKAMRMNPFPQSWYYGLLGWGYGLVRDYERARQASENAGWGYGLVRDYERARQASENAIRKEPAYLRAYLSLIVSYVNLGYEQEAYAKAQEVLRIDPSFSLGRFSKAVPYKDDSENERVLDALRKAGLM